LDSFWASSFFFLLLKFVEDVGIGLNEKEDFQPKVLVAVIAEVFLLSSIISSSEGFFTRNLCKERGLGKFQK
jgi:hypothetical protein